MIVIRKRFQAAEQVRLIMEPLFAISDSITPTYKANRLLDRLLRVESVAISVAKRLVSDLA